MKALVLTGRILPGFDEQRAWSKVAVLFKLDSQVFGTRILPRLPLSIREAADSTELQRVADAMQSAGAEIEKVDADSKWFLQQGSYVAGPVPLAYLKNERQTARLGGDAKVKQSIDQGWTTLAAALDEPMFTLDVPPEMDQGALDDEPPQLPNIPVNEPQGARSFTNGSSLTKCQACGRDISVLADKCPGCGAPNNWVHPSITEFMSNKDQTGVTQKFTFWSNKVELWGHTEKKLAWWMWIIFILLVPIFTINFVIAIIGIAIALVVSTAIFGRNKEFRANFQTGAWKSNDEVFWAPLRQKLRL